MIEEDNYYAFGLKIAPISSMAISPTLNPKLTSYGYQGSFAEELSEFGINYNDFDLPGCMTRNWVDGLLLKIKKNVKSYLLKFDVVACVDKSLVLLDKK